MLATTATANDRVSRDIAEQLSTDTTAPVHVLRGPLSRESLRLGVLTLPDEAQRIGWLLTHLNSLPGSGIIYTLTVSAAEDTANALRASGYELLAYTGKTDPDERLVAEQALKENRVKALVATSALGMGFDKPDLGFVVHLGAPSSAVSYYQQITAPDEVPLTLMFCSCPVVKTLPFGSILRPPPCPMRSRRWRCWMPSPSPRRG